mgnify:FL=1
MAKSKKKKVKYTKTKGVKFGTPQYEKGGGLKDFGMGLLETTGAGLISGALTGNTLAENFGYDYSTDAGKKFGKIAGKVTDVAGMAAPVVAGTFGGPAAGVAVGAAQGLNKQLNPNLQEKPILDPNYFNQQQENIDTRPAYFNHGGNPFAKRIEVEGPEIEVDSNTGKILKDFKGQPTHEKGGYQYNAKEGRVIIRGKDADKYKASDNFGRMSMVKEHILTQKNNAQLIDTYKRGGKINFKSTDAYHKWLGYVHASGLAESTPGNQKVSIRGKKVNVKHMQEGGYPDELISQQQRGIPGVNSSEYMKWLQTTQDPSDNSWTNYVETRDNPYGFAPTKEQLLSRNPSDYDNPATRQYPQVNISEQVQSNLPSSASTPPQQNQPFNWGTKDQWSQGINTAATWAPVAYNALMAFQKPVKEAPIYNPYEKESLSLLKKRIPYDPTLRAIETSGTNQRKAFSGTGGMSQGQLGSWFAQSSANEQKAKAEGMYNIDRANEQADRYESGALDTFGQQRVGADIYADKLNTMAKVNKAQYLPKGISQLGEIGRENLNIPMYKSLYEKQLAMQKDQQQGEMYYKYFFKQNGGDHEKAKKAAEEAMNENVEWNPSSGSSKGTWKMT